MDNFSHRLLYETFDNRYVSYRVTFQTVHLKSHAGAKYSHGCSVWTSHYISADQSSIVNFGGKYLGTYTDRGDQYIVFFP